jgi:hypothetical protein
MRGSLINGTINNDPLGVSVFIAIFERRSEMDGDDLAHLKAALLFSHPPAGGASRHGGRRSAAGYRRLGPP